MRSGKRLDSKISKLFPGKAISKTVIPAARNHEHAGYAEIAQLRDIKNDLKSEISKLESSVTTRLTTQDLIIQALNDYRAEQDQTPTAIPDLSTGWEFTVIRLSNNLTYKIIAKRI